MRKKADVGQLSLSARVGLCFSDPQSAGISLSALIGMYAFAYRFSIPFDRSELYFTDRDSMEIRIIAHDFSERSSSARDFDGENLANLIEKIELSPDKLPTSLDF